MKSFEYAAPDSLKEATALLSEKWGETEILAGGTDLVTSLKQQITQPKRLVSLKNIKVLRDIDKSRGTLRIGSMVRLKELTENRDVKNNFPSLVTAINNIASAQILAMGTVGGDLCQRPRCWYYRNGFGLMAKDGNTSLVRGGDNRYHAIFGTEEGDALFVNPSSLAPALVALGATFTAEGPNGKKREIPAANFFRAPKSEQEREIALNPNEVLTLVSIPVRGLKNATYEIRHRYGLDWPYVTASVAYAEKNGRPSEGQVVLGHVAATPWRAKAATDALNQAGSIDEAASRAAEAATQGARPLSKNAYKVQMAKTAVRRAVLATKQA
jgi:xanthine dehydrogenase YagS FAD-binding subunit